MSNVNGRIRIDAARVGGSIETVAGDIEVGAGSRVEGGILVEKPSGWSWGKQKNPPTATSSATSVFCSAISTVGTDWNQEPLLPGLRPMRSN